MTHYKIILFLCNWGPYAACQELLYSGFHIPAEIGVVRVPCTGRISRAMLFRPFEMGADGVALVGCASGSCRYGAGPMNGQDNIDDMRSIIDFLGLGRDRMRLGTFLPDESEALKTFLETFCEEIKELGKSPVPLVAEEIATPALEGSGSIAAVVKKHDIYNCQDCGKCTSSCPLALSGKEFSPHAIANAAIRGEGASGQMQKDIQSCLTCGICHERCPSDVNFPEFIRDMRRYIHESGGGSTGPHGGFFHSMMRTMASPAVLPKRWRHVSDDIQLDPEGKILFFGGCAPYFDAFFPKQQGVKTTEILEDALRLLNFFDIQPRILSGERCCGHDLLWSGDRANFQRLAKLNVEMVRDSGVEEVITSCPECYRTLAVDYEKNDVRTGFKVTHLYQFLERELDKGGVAFDPLGKKITYQDSCRLNRLESQRALPRKLIRRLTGTEFTEMRDSGLSALCCGNCAWTRCDAYSKALQVKRIRQARDTGGDLMVTSCPKCQIHLRCAMEDPSKGGPLSMEMIDLASVIARTIHWE
jgi:Fe-S oxidoreductase/coenzyme F420-reducing hydrogenase delta subunit